MKNLKTFSEHLNESDSGDSKTTAQKVADSFIKINGKLTTVKIEKRTHGCAIVNWFSGYESNVVLNINDDMSVKLNKNAIEPGGTYKFKTFDDCSDFAIWYVEEFKNVLEKATSGDNSALAAKFKRGVESTVNKFKTLRDVDEAANLPNRKGYHNPKIGAGMETPDPNIDKKMPLSYWLDKEAIEPGDYISMKGWPKALVDDIDYKKKKIELQFKENGPINSYGFKDGSLEKGEILTKYHG